MTVSEQIIQVLDALCEKFGLVIDWTSANVIPYLTTLCGKLIAYEIWTSVAWMGFAIIGFIASIIYLRWFRKATSVLDAEVHEILLVVASLAVCFLAIGCIGTQIMDIIKCTTFPELYIIEYIQKLINSNSGS